MIELNLEQAVDLIKAQKKLHAQAVLIRLLKKNVQNEAAWLWLATTMDNPRKTAYCLHRAVQINPQNERARKTLYHYLQIAKQQNLQPLSRSSPFAFHPKKLLECRIEQLNLPDDIYRRLADAGITRTDELIQATSGDLSQIEGLTPRHALVIKESYNLLASKSDERLLDHAHYQVEPQQKNPFPANNLQVEVYPESGVVSSKRVNDSSRVYEEILGKHKGSFRNTSNLLEQALMDDIKQVDLIGELNITLELFQKMSSVVRQVGLLRNGRIYPNRVPPALFITTMVFAARYTTEQARNFWTPYAQMVWQLKEANQTFQNKCRKRFNFALRELKLHSGITFLQQSSGEVVRPVFRHAIIPAYLQDNFAEWLKNQWNKILDIPPEALASELSGDQSVDLLPTQLQNFIRNSDTSEAAAALITKMAVGASLLAEGETVNEISEQFSKSPIERAIWDELSRVFEEHLEKAARRRSASGQIRWVWSIEYHEMQLQLRNFTFPKNNIPDRIVWTNDRSGSSGPDVEVNLSPWETNEGEWWLDEIILADGSESGIVEMLDSQQNILQRLPVPPLPSEAFTFFRPTHQDVFAHPLNDLSELRDGLWYISHEEGVRFEDADGNPIHPVEEKPVPLLLDEAHSFAGLYALKLPVTVLFGNQILNQITLPLNRSPSHATIESSSYIEGLLRQNPPIFADTRINLNIPGISLNILTRSVMWVKSEKETRRYSLVDLEEAKILKLSEDQTATIDLAKVLPEQTANYSIQLRQNLQSLLSTPVEFAVLQNVSVQPPNPGITYTPHNLPHCLIKGVQIENVVESERYTVEQQEGDHIMITWHDLREDNCRVQLFFHSKPITLSWPINRLFSWISPQIKKDFLRFDELPGYTFHVVSPRKHAQYFLMWLSENENKRRVDFNSRGHYSALIVKDSLYDMIKSQEKTSTTVYVSIFNQSWPLCEIRRQPDISRLEVTYRHDQESRILVTCSMEGSWPGDYQFVLHNLENPLDEPVAVWTSDRLEKQTTLPITLETGTYLLETLCNGLRLKAQNFHPVFSLGTTSSYVFSTNDIFTLLDSIKSSKAEFVPQSLAHDFVRLLRNQVLSHQTVEAKNRLFQLVTIPTPAIKVFLSNKFEKDWPSLKNLLYAYNLGQDNHHFHLLPGWAVTDKPLLIRLDGFHEPHLSIIPGRTAQKGHIGVGTTVLKLGYPKAEPRKVYIRWQRGDDSKLLLVIGAIPPNETQAVWKIDDLDLEPIYQCAQCGQLLHYRDWDTAKEQHVHRSGTPTYDDVLNSTVLHGYLIFRQAGWLDLDDPPENWVNRQYVLTGLKTLEFEFVQQDINPLTRQGYEYASYCWMTRMKTSASTKQQLGLLTRNGRWYIRLRTFERALEEANNARIPPFAALNRFLIAFDSGNVSFPLLQLDRILLLLTMLLRTAAYYPEQAIQLYEQLQLSQQDLFEMFKIADDNCPELLGWAFAWTEAFLIHATN